MIVEMKVFTVSGWYQFKTDCAMSIDRVQVAKNSDEALADVISSHKLNSKDYRYKLSVAEAV